MPDLSEEWGIGLPGLDFNSNKTDNPTGNYHLTSSLFWKGMKWLDR